MPPSEYWQRQCHVGASSVSRAETDLRHQIGVDQHDVRLRLPARRRARGRGRCDWIRATLGGIPDDEQRRILGANAAALYGFDLDVLAPIAARVGIPVADLAERADLPVARAHAGRPPGCDGRSLSRRRRLNDASARPAAVSRAGNCSGRVPSCAVTAFQAAPATAANTASDARASGGPASSTISTVDRRGVAWPGSRRTSGW